MLKIKNNTVIYGAPDEKGCLTIPLGVEKIGKKAFCRNKNIREIIFPETLTEIGEEAFLQCQNLQKVSLPKSVSKVGDRAFKNCVSLKSLKCFQSDVFFGVDCFLGCKSLGDYDNGLSKGRLFYVPKIDNFIISVFMKTLDNGVSLYKGRFSQGPSPSALPVSTCPILYIGVMKNAEGEDCVWFSTFVEDAVEGAYLQANKETISSHFGKLTLESEISPRQLSLICGFCSTGVKSWCNIAGVKMNQRFTIQQCLDRLDRALPGACRRLLFVLNHQEEIDRMNNLEYFLTMEEARSKNSLPSEYLAENY